MVKYNKFYNSLALSWIWLLCIFITFLSQILEEDVSKLCKIVYNTFVLTY